MGMEHGDPGLCYCEFLDYDSDVSHSAFPAFRKQEGFSGPEVICH